MLDEAALTELAQRTEFEAIVGEPDNRGNKVAALMREGALVGQPQPIKPYRLPHSSHRLAAARSCHPGIQSDALARRFWIGTVRLISTCPVAATAS